MRKTLLSIAIGILTLSGVANPVDFNRIQSWAGEGPNRAALVITNNAGASDPHVYVWGYHWGDDEKPTGEDMFKAICAANNNLVLLTQTTGIYGSTVCGIGVGDADKLLENIYFDFEKAVDYEFINFDYYNTNSFFGQSEAPGDNTPAICAAAIQQAITSGSHVIQHPLDQPTYGYPAYDYDCWDMTDEGWDYGWWTSAWYAGYWSYWTISGNQTDWMYSGTGFTGRQLSDGCVDGWSLTMFETPQVGGVGEGVPPSEDKGQYVYCDSSITTGIGQLPEPDLSEASEYVTLSGIPVKADHLTPGIYILRRGNSAKKLIIH